MNKKKNNTITKNINNKNKKRELLVFSNIFFL